jgi:hypothetical protein
MIFERPHAALRTLIARVGQGSTIRWSSA